MPYQQPIPSGSMDSIAFGNVTDSLGPNGANMVPDPAGAMMFGDPSGPSDRPQIVSSATGMGPQQGDPGFYEQCVNPNPTTPKPYNEVTSQGIFRG